MHSFDFIEPEDLDEAVRMLAFYDDACVMAGGSAVLLGMRQRMLTPPSVISIGKLEALRGITWDPTLGLRIGAATRHADIARSDLVREHAPLMAQVAGVLANPQVRNQGTIGGNLCYADPATDPPSALLALAAEVSIAGPRGQDRRLPMHAFLVDYFTTALQPGEILTAIHLPPAPPGQAGHYRRHLRTPAEHRPVANAALVFTQQDALWQDVRLVIGAAAPVARRFPRAEALLAGAPVTPEIARQAAALVAQDLDPMSDARGDAAYRTAMVRATVRRLIADAAQFDWKETAA